jgi:hypothetical protein
MVSSRRQTEYKVKIKTWEFRKKMERLRKDRTRRSEGNEWEPQISFEIFGRCPKIKPQKRMHTRTICSRANRWLSTSGDDQDVIWNNREPMEINPERTSEKQHTLCSGRLSRLMANYPWLLYRTVRDRGSDCPPVTCPKTQ